MSTAGAAEKGFPPLHLPSLAQIVAWFQDPRWGALPEQTSGTAAGHSHSATTASTRAGGGAGHPAGQGEGQLPPYAPLAKLIKQGPSGNAQRGFDARTSKRVASKSSATSDYYQNADGTFTRKLSATPINYQDASGAWQPIQTSLVGATGGRWAEKANSLSVSFAGRSSDAALAQVALPGSESFGYALSGAAPVAGAVSGSTITYAGVQPATDLSLETTATGLRENLTLHSAAAGNTWTFPLHLNGMTAKQAADGSIQLVDAAGTTVGEIPAGYAYDSRINPVSGEPQSTHAIAYTLQAAPGGGQQLVVTLDKAWLDDPARQFPVTLDPSTTLSVGNISTYVETTAADVGDHSMEPTIRIGSWNSGTNEANAFLRFPNGGLDYSGTTVTAASLSLYDVWASTCTAERFDVAPVTQPWVASQLTTYPGPSYGASIGNLTPSVPAGCANSGGDLSKGNWVTVPLATATLTNWAKNGASDYGLALYAATNDSLHWKQFDSMNSDWAPYLSLTYTTYLLPSISYQYPGNGASAGTLTPILSAEGSIDPNEEPAQSLKYDFQITDASGTKLADSGAIAASDWTVPAGKLAWGKSYYWTVQAYDGTNYSVNNAWNSLTTTVPQPAITSSLSQNSDGHGFDGAIGNYTTSATDAQVAVVGPTLDVVRDYNSRDPRVTGAFGAAWSSVFDSRASERYDSTGAVQSVVVTYPDGSEIGYGKNSNGTFSPPQGRFATFKSVTGGYSLTDKNDTTYTFTQSLGSGNYGITAISDALGRAVNFAWTSGEITTMTSVASSRALHLTWSTPAGATVAHVQTVATDPVTPGQTATALTWTYGYSGDQLTSACPPGTTTACTKYAYQGGSSYQTQILDEGATNYWPLSEASGTTANDAVLANEGADNATYANVTLGQAGPFTGGSGTAAQFNGTSSLLTLPSLHMGTGPSFTYSLWFKTTTANGVLVSASDNPLQATSTFGNFVPALYVGSDGKLNGLFWQNTQPTPIVSSAAVTDGKWHHVVFSSAPNLQTMWLDDKQVGTQPGWAALGDTAIAPWLLQYTYVGSGYLGYTWPDQPHPNSSTVYATYFNGTIAGVSYYNRPLTTADVGGQYSAATHAATLMTGITRPSTKAYAAVQYNAATNTVTQVTDENGGVWKLAPPTVAGSSQVFRSAVLGAKPRDYYRLGDGSGTTNPANEVHGVAAAYNAATLGVAGPFSDETAASLNGTSSYVSLAYGLLGNPTQSLGIWFKTSSANGVLVGTNGVPVTNSGSAGFDPLLYVGNDGKLAAEAWTGDAYTPMYSKSAVDDGKWHYAVISVAGTTQTLYVDGTSQATKSGTVNMTGALYDYIGAGWMGGTWPDDSLSGKTSAVQYFNGSVGEVASYPTALSGDQVAAQYGAARGSQGLLPVETVVTTDPGGKTVTDRYDVANNYRKISETDGLGNTTSYGYDTSGYLYTTTDPNGNVTTTGHDVRGNIVSQTTCQNQATNVCSTAYYTYYPDDTTAQLTTADPRNDVMLTARDGRSASATDNTYETTYTYDTKGDKTAVTTPAVPGFPGGRTTTITYSDGTSAFPAVDTGAVPAGLPVKTVSPSGAVNTVAYFHDGDVAQTVNAEDLATTFTYDGIGRVAAKTVSPRQTAGWWPLTQTTGTSVTDSSGSGNTATATNMTWTGTAGAFNGSSSYMQLPSGLVAASPMVSISLWFDTTATTAGTLFSTDHDLPTNTTPGPGAMPVLYVGSDGKLHGHLWDTTVAGIVSAGAVNDGKWHHVVLSGAGTSQALYLDGALVGSLSNQVQNLDPYELVGAGVYNNDGWPAAPNGDTWNYFNGQIANVQLYQRALSAAEAASLHTAGQGGTAIANPTPAAQVTSFQYDGQDRVTQQTDPAVTDRVTGAVHTSVTANTYDPDGDLTQQVVSDSTGGDASRTTSSTYNQYDQVQTSTDADNNQTSFTYDAYGNKQTQTDPDSTATSWTYDANGHELTQAITNYTGSPLNPQTATTMTEWSKAYDPAGRIASVTDAMGNVSKYTYFDDNQVATVTKTDPAGKNAYVEESDTYDAAGNQITKTTDNGATVEDVAVDAADRTVDTTFDPSGVDRTTTYSYTPDDQVATQTQTDPTGATEVTAATYDGMGQPTSQSTYQDGAGHPTGWWPLTQAGGTNVTDASGTGDTATATGVTWTGSSASFPGTAGQQIATNGPVLNTAGSFTVSAWADLSSVGSTFQDLVSQDSKNNSGFELQYDTADSAWAFSRSSADTTSPSVIKAHGTTKPTAGTWYHLVGTYNASTGAMTLYVNGAAAGSATDTTPYAANGPLVMGRGQFVAAPTALLDGQVSNVQAYPRVLSAAEISTLYTAGHNGGTTASSSWITTSRTYDQRGLPLTSTDANNNTTDYTYDEAGHLAVTTDPAVAVETNGGTPVQEHPTTVTGYNTFGEPVENQDADGNVVTTVYDANGNKVSQTRPNYTPPGSTTPITATTVWNYTKLNQVESITDPLTHAASYVYDQLGDTVQTTDPNTGVTDQTYDLNGQLLSTTDPTGAQTQATYDWMGRQQTATVLDRYPTATTSTTTYSYAASAANPDGAFLASSTSQDGAATSFTYDNVGEQTAVKDPAGNTTSTSYDFLGRTAAVTAPDSTSTSTSYDAIGDVVQRQQKDATGAVLATTSSTYDGMGQVLSTTDARGNTSNFLYDATGALTQEIQPVTATTSITTSFGYDANGNRTRYTDGRGNAWIYTYNPWNLQESVIEPETSTDNTAALSTFTTAYDADGRAATQTQPGGVTLTFGYDNEGNVLNESGAGADAATATRSFTYDGDGKVLTAATTTAGTQGSAGYQAASSNTFTYNDRGELLTTSGAAGSSTFAYNGDGLMTSRQDAAGTTSYGYSTSDQLSTVTDAATGVASAYSYNKLDQVSQIQYGTGGDLRNYTYNSLHELTGDTLTNSAGTTTIASIGYGYDPNGNLTSKTTTGFDGASANSYTYDFANRLTSWMSGTTTTDYGYDASGNRTQVGANVYTYDARDELTGDGTNSYTYSARGTLTQQSSSSAATAYSSDAFGQQITVGQQSYSYDATGRMLSDAATGGSTLSFAYSGAGNILASDGASTYTWTPANTLVGIGTAASGGGTVAGSGELAYVDQHTDVVGDFTATGAALDGSTTYDPLGNVTATSGQAGSLGYQSAWTDKATGKVDMGSRWYSPSTGQFMNRDTMAVNPAPDSAAANPFAYDGGNPMLATDPTGHCFLGIACGIQNDIGNWASSAWNDTTSFVSTAWNDTTSFVSSAWNDAVSALDSTISFLDNELKQLEAETTRLLNEASNWVSDAWDWSSHQVSHAWHATTSTVKHWYRAAVNTGKKVVHTVAADYHKAVSYAKKAVASTATFVKNHAATIASIVVGAGTFIGCEGLTLGVGTVGCAALAGAASSGVSYLMSCGKTQQGCSLTGGLEAVGEGALGGAVGGALAGPLGGKLASEALSGILPDVATNALVGAYAGGGAGAITGAVGYAASCGSSQAGCSWSGLGGATLGGAEQGAAMGGIGGAGASLVGSGISALRGDEPQAGTEPESSPSCHSFTGGTEVLMASGAKKPIDQVKVGDKVANTVPGQAGTQDNTVTGVIVTKTDHDFVDVKVKPVAAGTADAAATSPKSNTLKKAGLGLAASLAVLAGAATTSTHTGGTPADAAQVQATTPAGGESGDVTEDGGTLTTTFLHPFYDATQAAFVEAQHLQVGDELQTPTGSAVVIGLHLYHANTVTYDLTIGALHTYYVVAGDTPVLVHNMNEEQCAVPAPQDVNWPNFRSTKTAATPDEGATFTLSGWSSRISRAFTRVSTNVTAGLRNMFGMAAKGSGNDLGVNGRYFDSHAERQAYALNPGSPIIVTRDPCAECQQFFSYASVYNQESYVISSPSGRWAFHPTGDMEFIPNVPYAPEPPG
jgi:RHS repeat-associated protein